MRASTHITYYVVSSAIGGAAAAGACELCLRRHVPPSRHGGRLGRGRPSGEGTDHLSTRSELERQMPAEVDRRPIGLIVAGGRGRR